MGADLQELISSTTWQDLNFFPCPFLQKWLDNLLIVKVTLLPYQKGLSRKKKMKKKMEGIYS